MSDDRNSGARGPGGEEPRDGRAPRERGNTNGHGPQGDRPRTSFAANGRSGERRGQGGRPSSGAPRFARPAEGGERPQGEHRPRFEKRPYGEGGDRKPFERKPYDGERKPFEKRPYGDGGERKPCDRKP